MKVSYGKKVSVSFKKSAKQTSIKHNNRDLDYEEKQNKWHKHIDHDRSSLNKTLVKKDIKEMYEEIFGDAVQEYNAKQKRSDRKIKNYYSKILQNKKMEPQREFILQIGDKPVGSQESVPLRRAYLRKKARNSCSSIWMKVKGKISQTT